MVVVQNVEHEYNRSIVQYKEHLSDDEMNEVESVLTMYHNSIISLM